MTFEDLKRELHDRRLRDSDIIQTMAEEVAAEEWRMGTRTMGLAALGYAIFCAFLSLTGVLPAAYFAGAAVAGALVALAGAWKLKQTIAAFKLAMRKHVDAWEAAEVKRYVGADTGEGGLS